MKQIYKKLLAAALGVSMLLSMVGCGQNDTSDQTQTGGENEAKVLTIVTAKELDSLTTLTMNKENNMDNIAYISQDNYLFDETVLENIRMGKPSATDEEVYQAARDCGCYDFILNLENGFHTVVGGAGGHLSGGERQRIAIARAVLKNAPIVILDEATAYIDAENEALIQEAMAKVIAGKTVLMIAHRLSTITDADKIVVVKDGQIIGEGTHENLLTSCMLYQEMWKAHMDTKDVA